MEPQSPHQEHIYCAGPLFNREEKEAMERIAEALEAAGYKTFLPHRDGLEFSKVSDILVAKGYSHDIVASILSRAIFALDVFQVKNSDGLVLNMNGRVPDEGAMVEAGIAWATLKKIVIFKNDTRSLLQGTDNPLVLGLSNFSSVATPEDVVARFKVLFDKSAQPLKNQVIDENSYPEMVEKGKVIYEYMAKNKNDDELCSAIIKLFGEEIQHDAEKQPAKQIA